MQMLFGDSFQGSHYIPHPQLQRKMKLTPSQARNMANEILPPFIKSIHSQQIYNELSVPCVVSANEDSDGH